MSDKKASRKGHLQKVVKAQKAHPSKVCFGVFALEADVLPLFGHSTRQRNTWKKKKLSRRGLRSTEVLANYTHLLLTQQLRVRFPALLLLRLINGAG